MKSALLFSVLLMASSAFATVIESAFYDSNVQTLYLTVAFQGGEKQHDFELEWDKCSQVGSEQIIEARLIDSGWDDVGTIPQVRHLEFDLSAQTCKPATLTIRSGRYSIATVHIN